MIPLFSEIWINRKNSNEDENKCRNVFKYCNVMNNLKELNTELGDICNDLYNKCIDYGAHPNEPGLSSQLRITKSQDFLQYDILHLTSDPKIISYHLKFICDVTILILKILYLIIPNQLNKSNISDKINRVEESL